MLTRVRPPEAAGAGAAGACAAAAGADASAPAERCGGAADWQATAASKTLVRTNAATLRVGIGRHSFSVSRSGRRPPCLVAFPGAAASAERYPHHYGFQAVRLAWQRRPLLSTLVAGGPGEGPGGARSIASG